VHNYLYHHQQHPHDKTLPLGGGHGGKKKSFNHSQNKLCHSVAALPSADILRPAPAVAALLNASGSEDSRRGPYQQA
jgi:hypothetical protein